MTFKETRKWLTHIEIYIDGKLNREANTLIMEQNYIEIDTLDGYKYTEYIIRDKEQNTFVTIYI